MYRHVLGGGDAIEQVCVDREGLVRGERPARGRFVSRDVEQHAASDDPAPRDDLDAERVARGIVDARGVDAVVEPVPRMRDVPQPVPLARALEVEPVQPVVAPEAAGADLMAHWQLPERRWVGQLDVPVEREDLTRPHLGRARLRALGREEIQRAELVVGAEDPPCGAGRRIGAREELAVGRQSRGKRHG